MGRHWSAAFSKNDMRSQSYKSERCPGLLIDAKEGHSGEPDISNVIISGHSDTLRLLGSCAMVSVFRRCFTIYQVLARGLVHPLRHLSLPIILSAEKESINKRYAGLITRERMASWCLGTEPTLWPD